MSLLSVGTMAFDSIETPLGKADHIIGGSGIYVAWAATHFYRPIHQVSIIGNDFPESEMQELSLRGVNFDGVESVKDGKSFFWSGKYHEDMNSRDTLITELNVLEQFDPKLPENYKKTKMPDAGQSCTGFTNFRIRPTQGKTGTGSPRHDELLDGCGAG